MKFKLTEDEGMLLEDILLDLYYNLTPQTWAGDSELSRLLNRLQDKLWGEVQ